MSRCNGTLPAGTRNSKGTRRIACKPLAAVAHRIAEAGHAHPVLRQPLQVNVRRDHLLAVRKALGLGQQVGVLVDQRMPVPGQVGGGFARAGAGIQIGGDALARLRGAEVVAVFGLADGDVAGREVDQHGRARQRRVGARRDGRPHVLANLGVQAEALEVGRLEDQVVAEGHALAQEPHFAADARRGRRRTAASRNTRGNSAGRSWAPAPAPARDRSPPRS